MAKERVDRLLVARQLAPSRARARALIEAGRVHADGAPVLKPAEWVSLTAALSVEPDHPYVSRGGLKLEGALEDLQVSPAGLVAADIGASTGGFTDCLLQQGAVRVYAIDVGRDQLHARLRADRRVVNMEQVNARHLTARSLPQPVDLVVVDASFISLSKLLPALAVLCGPCGRLLALVKPQFELGPGRVDGRGVVRDDADRVRALSQVVASAVREGLRLVASADSRIHGPQGNREIFALFARGAPP